MREGGRRFSVGVEEKELPMWIPDPGGMWSEPRPSTPQPIKSERGLAARKRLVDGAVAIKLRCAELSFENPQDVDGLIQLQHDRSILVAKLDTAEYGEVERRVKEELELSSVS